MRVIKSRRLRVAGFGERKGSYKVLIGIPEEERPQERPRLH
jgi:hypothetical protein